MEEEIIEKVKCPQSTVVYFMKVVPEMTNISERKK